MRRFLPILALLIVNGWLLSPPADAGTPPAATPAAVTAFFWDSDPREFVGGGYNGLLNAATGSLFTATQSDLGGLVCTVSPDPAISGANKGFWTLNFYTGNNVAPHVGNYEALFPETTGITLDVYDGDTDEDIQGDFQVLELAYNPDGTIERLAVNFDQYEFGATDGLHGQFRYNSTVGLQPAVRVLAAPGQIFAGGGPTKMFKIMRAGDLTQPLAVTFLLSSKDTYGSGPPAAHTVIIPAGRPSIHLRLVIFRQPSLPNDFTVTLKLKLKVPADQSYAVRRDRTARVTVYQ